MVHLETNAAESQSAGEGGVVGLGVAVGVGVGGVDVEGGRSYALEEGELV